MSYSGWNSLWGSSLPKQSTDLSVFHLFSNISCSLAILHEIHTYAVKCTCTNGSHRREYFEVRSCALKKGIWRKSLHMLLSNKASSNLITALTMHAWYVLKVFCIAVDVVHQLFIHKHAWKSSMYVHSLQLLLPHLVFNGHICSYCAEFFDHFLVPSSLYCIHEGCFPLLQERRICANENACLDTNNMTTLVYSTYLYRTSCAEKTHLAFDIQNWIICHQYFYNFQVTTLSSSHEGSHSILMHHKIECSVCVNVRLRVHVCMYNSLCACK